MVAASTTAPAQSTVRQRSDDPCQRARTWASDTEVLELVEEAHQRLRPGKRFYSNLANHLVLAYHELRKWEAQTPAERDGRRVVSLLHITSNLYDVARTDYRAAMTKSESLRRHWLPILREAGLVEYDTQRDAAGRPVGIRYALVGDTLAARRDSSVGGAIPDTFPTEWLRRPETRSERQAARTKPWCRRAGQSDAAAVAGPSVKRLVRRAGGTAAGCPSSSSVGDFASPGSRPPRNYVPGGLDREGVSVRVRAGAAQAGCAGLSDAAQPPWWMERIAALEAELADGASKEAGLAALAALVSEGAPIEAALCAAWRAVWRRPARMSRRALLDLRNSRRIIERCSGLPGPADGGDRATAWLLCDVAEYHEDHAAGRSLAKTAPGSVGFFVRRLRKEARGERRAWRARRSYAAEGSS